MEGEVNVTVETAPETPAVVETVVETQVETVIDAAVEIADKITENREQSTAVIITLETIAGTLGSVLAAIGELGQRLDYLTDEIATLSAIETAEIVVENTPAEVEEIADVAAVVENTPPEVPEAPQVREQKKARKYL